MKSWADVPRQTIRNEPLTNDHEELLGTFLNFPHLFQDFRYRLDSTLFYDLWWLFEVMCQVDDAEGLTYRGVVNQVPTAHLKTIQQLRSQGYSERRADILLTQIKKARLAENMRTIGMELFQALSDNEDPDELLRQLQQRSYELFTTDTNQILDMEKQVNEYAERMLEIADDPAKAYGLMTGMSCLDIITTGWHRSDFSVIGARTSMGKSAFMLENILRLNQKGYKCAVFSLEMSRKQMYDRMTANLLQVNYKQYRFGKLARQDYGPMLEKAKKQIVTVYVDDSRGVDADYIADTMRRLKRTQGLDFVVVDYLQDVKEKGETNDNQGSALGRVCRKLRKAAQENDCHVMGISQVARAAEYQSDKRPGNADLSGSTGIETSADVIALLYRDDYYNPNSDKKNILEVNFTKQRNGEVGMVELHYDRTTQRITPLNR